MKYFLYCRKSSEDADRQVQSIDDQKKVMQEMAKNRGIEIIKIFEESQSAKSPGRQHFSEMMERIHMGEAQGILSWKLDRLARNPIDGGNVIWMLQTGILQKIITSDREYHPHDNVLMMSVEFGMANQFILDLSKNVKRGMRAKYEKGIRPTRAPLGYMNDKIEHTINSDPERFHLVRKMWDLMITGGYTPEKIAEIAYKKWGLTSRTTKRILGKPIGRSMAYRIFRNPFYCGLIEVDGELREGIHEPMITKKEYDKVQKTLGRKGNPRANKKEFPFTGLLKCGECGCAITAEDKSKYLKGEKSVKFYTYYHCTKKKPHPDGSKCSQKCIETAKLETQIIDFLADIRVSDEFFEWQRRWAVTQTDRETEDRETAKRNLNRNLGRASKKMDNLIKLKINDPDLFTNEEFKNQKNEIIQEKNNILAELKELDNKQNSWIDLADRIYAFSLYAKEKFENGTLEEKRYILSCTGSKIILKDGKLDIEGKKVFRVIEKYRKKGAFEKQRFEPAEKSINKTKKPFLTAENPMWLGR
jgi:site-specific DNA recombinase